MPGPAFQISCVQLTMEPVPLMLGTARALDRHGFGTYLTPPQA